MPIPEASVFVDGEQIDENQLKSIISNELENSLGIDGGKLSNQRRDALKQYLGEPYGNELEGRSQVVDRTIMETVEWVLPALLRIFMGADKVVQVEPQLPEDEEIAKQQTEYVNYILTRDNDGFFIIYTWFKDALMQKLGWLKRDWDVERKIEDEKYEGLTEEQYQALVSDPDVEVVDRVAYPAFGPAMGLEHVKSTRKGAQPGPLGESSPLTPSPANANPPPQTPTIYNCTLRRTKNHGRVKITPAAPEEILVSRRATPYQFGQIPFLAHRRRCTRSELIEMGFDRDTVMSLSGFDEPEYNTERVQRFEKNDEWPYRSSRTDPAMVEVWINECYLRVDWDNDGIAELRKVVVAGDKSYIILSNDVADEIPFNAITPVPMPHTMFGLSLADLVSDLQLIKTTLWRQMLDNLYLANNPRKYVNINGITDETYDDLLTSRVGGLVRGNGPMETVIGDLNVPFVAADAFPMVQYLEQTAQRRSGVNDGNQGIAPDDLNKQSQIGSMGIGMLQEAAAQRVELIARIFAEGYKELCKGILGLVVKNQQDPRIVKLTGAWAQVDPSTWKTQFEMTVTVGLGTGNRERMVAQLMQLLQVQMQGVTMQKGVSGPLFVGENLYHSVKQLVSAMGFKNPDDFVQDPAKSGPAPPPPPDPHVEAAKIKAQTDIQTSQQKSQVDASNSQAELAMRERLGVLELQLKQQQFMAELELKKAQLGLDMQTTAAELGMKQQDQSLKGKDHELKAKDHDLKVRTTPGATTIKKRVTVHRGPDGKIAGADVEEMPVPQPGSLPEGPRAG